MGSILDDYIGVCPKVKLREYNVK